MAESSITPLDLGVVFAGGAAGTGIRLLLVSAAPHAWGPLATLGINVLGAFLIGMVLERMAVAAPSAESAARRRLRLLLTTGALGGFTTYSALATDTVQFLTVGEGALAVVYALGTVLLGAAAAFAGVVAGSLLLGRRS